MAKILVYSEMSGPRPKTITLEILGKLTGHHLEVAIIGEIQEEGLNELAKYGAENVYCIQSEKLNHYSADGHAMALKKVIDENNYDYVFAGSTSAGKDFMPRLAALYQAGMASELTDFDMEKDQLLGMRPLFAGKCLAKVEIKGPRPHFLTVRPNALGLAENPTSKTAKKVEIQVESGDLKAIVKEIVKGTSDKLDLTEANIIVSGGRAMGNGENFKILNELAEVLGATVGASRAAVDSGYAPHDQQVGQTGKTVSPSLYIACGISGAIQHLAGMRTSRVIVAINTDPEAPIFAKADYGIVGDLFKIVPLLTEEFKKVLEK